MNQFSLISEHGRPIAALIPHGLSPTQLRDIYSLLPPSSFNDPELATRWQCALVASPADWASAQKRRVPMLAPKQQLRLAFL